MDSRRAAQVLSVNLALEHGLLLCAQRGLGKGLTWLARALEIAPDDAHNLQRVIRPNLAGWSAELVRLQKSSGGPNRLPL